MKKGCFILVLCLMFLSANAQNSLRDPAIDTYPKGKTQLGWYYGDYIHTGSFSFDVVHRWEGRNSFGVGYGILNDHNYSYTSIDDTLQTGTDFRFFHKLYLMGTINDNFLYLRHGLRFKEAVFSYHVTDFYEFEEYGNTYLRKETRKYEEEVSQTGYEVIIGGEVYRNFFFLDFYAGVGYYTAFNEEYSSRKKLNEISNDPRRNGSLFLLGFRAGIYLN